ncbi:hypothetical protein BAE44_0014867 [Dichanthelium oligosanthes]|uniref:Uncharacterized protein n=1 Tax=Dichanthelium oligosanthes TaxID=888268 RepID=A0A1E5VGE0_9POAL|nr:hypothetical protein BAE44_0014867 [Dichanthelium oligosanthes]
MVPPSGDKETEVGCSGGVAAVEVLCVGVCWDAAEMRAGQCSSRARALTPRRCAVESGSALSREPKEADSKSLSLKDGTKEESSLSGIHLDTDAALWQAGRNGGWRTTGKPRSSRRSAPGSSAGAGVPVFDTSTLGLAVAPLPQGHALAQCPTLVAVGGDRIYGLEGTKAAGDREVCHFEVLRAPAPPGRRQWSCRLLRRAPRRPHLVLLRRAPYDARLDAWVGICGDDTDDAGARGRVCWCDVVAPGRRRIPAPEWKLEAEPLFFEDEKRHAGAALVYMGNSRFCLLEFVKPTPEPVKPKATGTKKVWKEKQPESRRPPDSSVHLLHVTAFGLKYGDEGELTAAAMRRQRRSYAVPEGAAKFLKKPVAFCM